MIPETFFGGESLDSLEDSSESLFESLESLEESFWFLALVLGLFGFLGVATARICAHTRVRKQPDDSNRFCALVADFDKRHSASIRPSGQRARRRYCLSERCERPCTIGVFNSAHTAE